MTLLEKTRTVLGGPFRVDQARDHPPTQWLRALGDIVKYCLRLRSGIGNVLGSMQFFCFTILEFFFRYSSVLLGK